MGSDGWEVGDEGWRIGGEGWSSIKKAQIILINSDKQSQCLLTPLVTLERSFFEKFTTFHNTWKPDDLFIQFGKFTTKDNISVEKISYYILR